MSQLHNFVIKSASGLILGKEQISVAPAKGCRKNLKRHPDPKVKHIRYEERNGESDAPHGYRGFTSTRLNGKGQPTMADVLASISERQAANNRKGGTR
jgi:hypothetical protein